MDQSEAFKMRFKGKAQLIDKDGHLGVVQKSQIPIEKESTPIKVERKIIGEKNSQLQSEEREYSPYYRTGMAPQRFQQQSDSRQTIHQNQRVLGGDQFLNRRNSKSFSHAQQHSKDSPPAPLHYQNSQHFFFEALDTPVQLKAHLPHGFGEQTTVVNQGGYNIINLHPVQMPTSTTVTTITTTTGPLPPLVADNFNARKIVKFRRKIEDMQQRVMDVQPSIQGAYYVNKDVDNGIKKVAGFSESLRKMYLRRDQVNLAPNQPIDEQSRNQEIKAAQSTGNASRRIIKNAHGMIDYYDKSISSKVLQSHLQSLQEQPQRQARKLQNTSITVLNQAQSEINFTQQVNSIQSQATLISDREEFRESQQTLKSYSRSINPRMKSEEKASSWKPADFAQNRIQDIIINHQGEHKPIRFVEFAQSNPGKYYQLGGLGPSNIGTEQWMKAKEKQRNITEFMYNLSYQQRPVEVTINQVNDRRVSRNTQFRIKSLTEKKQRMPAFDSYGLNQNEAY